jgi:hypothetical protein
VDVDVAGNPPLTPIGQIPAALYVVFLLGLLIDIGGAFGIKYAAFVIVVMYLALSALKLRFSVPLSFVLIEGLLFGIAPLLFFSIAIAVFSVPPDLAFTQVTSFAVWLLYPLLIQVQPKSQLISTFTRVMFIGAVLTIVMFAILVALFLIGRLDIIEALNVFMDSHRLGYFGQRPIGEQTFEFFPNVYFRWTLLMLPAALLTFGKRSAQFATFVAAVLATVSTAAILFLLVSVCWAAVAMVARREGHAWQIRRSLALILLLLLLIAFGLYATGRGQIVPFVLSKLSPESVPTSIKMGHIESILELVARSPLTLLFGTGAGSTFYSIGTSSVVGAVEVSHFDLVRQFGLLYGLAFTAYCTMLVLTVRRMDFTGRMLALSVVILFVAAGTNPLLISPVFFLMLVISRAYVTITARERRLAPSANSSTTSS